MHFNLIQLCKDGYMLDKRGKSRCISDAKALPLRVRFSKLQTVQRSMFSVVSKINCVLHPAFDLSICGQVPGYVSLILTVLNAVLGRKEPALKSAPFAILKILLGAEVSLIHRASTITSTHRPNHNKKIEKHITSFFS
jgi:hypothetical protein